MKPHTGFPHFIFVAAWLLAGAPLFAAAEPKVEEIPASSQRPVVLQLDATGVRKQSANVPKAHLPAGYELSVAAAAPLVTHPTMACLDDKGRLFLGDGVGVNWNKAQLDANPPNRVLLLEDTDKDGVFDKSTIFADRMTFPQGGLWLNGSLYVASPPGIWKLTDTDGDGVADQREMIVSGFDYTGNAADIHGPFLHPNGRLYWCHGRKGFRVTNKQGQVVHEGGTSGIWSAKPDGSDVQWHSLLAGDNPVEIDFTPQGDIIGVQNLYYSQPRGDTINHWLYGGVYERGDLMNVIAGLPRTLETMPVMYDFGHVAVSGSCFWKSYEGGGGGQRPLHYLVTHFNTQRLVRMELTPDGSTYQARENEFLKLEDPDVHFTDVMEDADGSLLVVNTGGWFRIGCPSSLMAKPDVLGSVYRVRPTSGIAAQSKSAWQTAYRPPGSSTEELLNGLSSHDPQVRLRTLSAIAETDRRDAALTARMLAMMGETMDAPLEHALLFAARKTGIVNSVATLRASASPTALRRVLVSLSTNDAETLKQTHGIARQHLDSSDEDLARVALKMVVGKTSPEPAVMSTLQTWLKESSVSPERLRALQGFTAALLGSGDAQQLVTAMLNHPSSQVRRVAFETLAGQNVGASNPDWLPAFEKGFAEKSGPAPLLLDALKKLKTPRLDPQLATIANDAQRPPALRLKALDAMHVRKLTPETFAMLQSMLTSGSSSAARIQAATMLRSGSLNKEQVTALAPAFAMIGPIELKELLPIVRQVKEADTARAIAIELAKNPSLISQQESMYRTTFSSHPPELFENIILPARRSGEAAIDARKRRIGPLADNVAAKGKAAAGRQNFEAGKGSCIACHKIGATGRPIGPDLSKIGAIRTERDLVESILFPSNTLARDYETHIIETSDGQTTMGVIRSHTADGLLVVDVAGQEKNLPHEKIISNTTLTDSLMPMGLDGTMSEQELFDLVAWLRSLK
jgi:putative heme-binding domain-containing protein